MTIEKVKNLLENENFDGFKIKFKYAQPIPMGMSLHFEVFPKVSKEVVDIQMIERFGRSFNSFDGTDYLFLVTNGTKFDIVG